MKFKSKAIPEPSEGLSFEGIPDMTVPNQSMSLLEILTRFTRGEALPIGQEVNYHESDDDLEKVGKMDLVDKAEFRDKLEETKKRYDRQEKAKAKKAREEAQAKILEEEKQKLKKQAEEDSAKAK